jgi:hypothetical protein
MVDAFDGLCLSLPPLHLLTVALKVLMMAMTTQSVTCISGLHGYTDAFGRLIAVYLKGGCCTLVLASLASCESILTRSLLYRDA